MKALLGTKLGMTQLFDAEGNVLRVTVIATGENVVTQIKTMDKDGYSAVQLGFGARKASSAIRVSMPVTSQARADSGKLAAIS